jgi:hypothetical protein
LKISVVSHAKKQCTLFGLSQKNTYSLSFGFAAFTDFGAFVAFIVLPLAQAVRGSGSQPVNSEKTVVVLPVSEFDLYLQVNQRNRCSKIVLQSRKGVEE